MSKQCAKEFPDRRLCFATNDLHAGSLARATTSNVWAFIVLAGFALGLGCGVAAFILERSRLRPGIVVPAVIGLVLNTPPFLLMQLTVLFIIFDKR